MPNNRTMKAKKTDCPFRKWRIKEGYTVKDFAQEATRLGKRTDEGTVWRWDKGTIPLLNTQGDLRDLFQGIKF